MRNAFYRELSRSHGPNLFANAGANSGLFIGCRAVALPRSRVTTYRTAHFCRVFHAMQAVAHAMQAVAQPSSTMYRSDMVSVHGLAARFRVVVP